MKTYKYIFKLRGDNMEYSFIGTHEAFKASYPSVDSYQRVESPDWDEKTKKYI